MDPITTAIVAALVAGAIGGVTQVGEHVITDAYQALKAALKNKYGADSMQEAASSFATSL